MGEARVEGAAGRDRVEARHGAVDLRKTLDPRARRRNRAQKAARIGMARLAHDLLDGADLGQPAGHTGRPRGRRRRWRRCHRPGAGVCTGSYAGRDTRSRRQARSVRGRLREGPAGPFFMLLGRGAPEAWPAETSTSQ